MCAGAVPRCPGSPPPPGCPARGPRCRTRASRSPHRTASSVPSGFITSPGLLARSSRRATSRSAMVSSNSARTSSRVRDRRRSTGTSVIRPKPSVACGSESQSGSCGGSWRPELGALDPGHVRHDVGHGPPGEHRRVAPLGAGRRVPEVGHRLAPDVDRIGCRHVVSCRVGHGPQATGMPWPTRSRPPPRRATLRPSAMHSGTPTPCRAEPAGVPARDLGQGCLHRCDPIQVADRVRRHRVGPAGHPGERGLPADPQDLRRHAR